MAAKAVFLDRDGVINEDRGYVYKQSDFVFKEYIFEFLQNCTAKNYLLFVVTNQSGIARGYYSEDEFLKLTDYMLKEFAAHDIKIAKVYYCPHAPEANCQCRKPNPQMILDAQKEFDIDMSASYLIGDKPSDIEAGLKAGVKNLIYFGENECPNAHKIKSLKEAMKLVL
jgi:D-glycero-D-manno-heptose 1,7-bisphosphate phosphatase